MILLSQRINYANIVPLRNYTRIQYRPENKVVNNYDNPFGEIFELKDSPPTLILGKQQKQIQLRKLKDIKGRSKFFYGADDTPTQSIPLDFLLNTMDGRHNFETTKQRHISRHYANPFSEIIIHLFERTIRVDNDKVYIKLYHHTKTRGHNCRYFRRNSSLMTISFNKKNGDIIISRETKSSNKSSRCSSSIRRNHFNGLSDLIKTNNYFNIFKLGGVIHQFSSFFGEFYEVMNDRDFMMVLLTELGLSVENIDLNMNTKEDEGRLLDLFIDFFIKNKKIKTPNEYHRLIEFYYPTEKFLKKNERKLIQSILDFFNIKSKFNIKLLHKYPTIDIQLYRKFCEFFGEDYYKYLSNIDEDFYKQIYYIKNLML